MTTTQSRDRDDNGPGGNRDRGAVHIADERRDDIIIATAEVMSTDEARRLTERIRLNAHTARESIEKLHVLVDQAKAGNAHVALGYSSWTAYLAEVLGEEPLRLARDQRQELVGYLSGEGMSTRAIAPIVGVSQKTIARDVGDVRAPESDDSPDPLDDVGVIAPDALDQAVAGLRSFMTDHPMPTKTITGMDGKTYRPPERKPSSAPKRRPLPDYARGVADELRKAASHVDKIAADDRLLRNRDMVTHRLRGDLDRMIAACQALHTLLTHNEEGAS